MKEILQDILDRCFYARQHIVTAIAFLTLRVYGKEIEYGDVREGTFKSRKPPSLSLEEAKDVETLLNMSREGLANAEKRRTVVTDKCKTLLTLGSLLLGVIGLLLPKYLAFDSALMRGLSVLAIASVFNAIVLLLMFFDVGQEMEMSLAQADIPLDSVNLKKSLLNNYLKCIAASENRTDYLVELYRAARFCFLSALTIIAGLVLASVIMNSPADHTERIVRELRSDSELTTLLHGPKGLKGDRGEKGERGNDANTDDVTTQLLSDPRILDVIDRTIERQRKNATIQ